MTPEAPKEILAHDLSGPIRAESSAFAPVAPDAQTAPKAETPQVALAPIDRSLGSLAMKAIKTPRAEDLIAYPGMPVGC